MKEEIPVWNLDTLFKDIKRSEYKKALEDYESCMNGIDSLLSAAQKLSEQVGEQFDFEKWLDSFLTEYNREMHFAKTLGAYAYIIYSTDTINPDFLNNMTAVDKMSIRVSQQQIAFSRLLALHKDKLESFYKNNPQYEEYKFLLNEIIEDTKHQMSPEEEKLASDMNQTGGSAWGMLQEQIISNLQNKNGKTFNEIRNDAYDANPAVRKEAWQTELELLSQNRIAIAAALNNLKGQTLLLNRRRNWNTALDRALFASRLSRASLDSLIGAIEDSLPMWRTYFTAKASYLRKTGATKSETAGTKENPGIAFYDLFAPLGTMQKEWTFSEAREYILKEYYSFSKDMGDFAEKAFASGWIDAKVRTGKVGGAYDEDFPMGHQSRILSNFTGAFSDIITLAHELGHAYHFSCMKEKPALFFDYPMTLAETASTFAETIVKQDMIANSSASDKLQILDLDLQDASQVLVDILCRFYFERSVFEERNETELTADDFCRLMKDAQEKSYGSGLNSERHEYMWAVKSHYYSTDLDFYNFPYAFGQLFAASLYMQSRKEGASFAKTYSTLLSHTGSMSCEDLCRLAGFDISKKEFWKKGIDMYAKEIETFCEVTK